MAGTRLASFLRLCFLAYAFLRETAPDRAAIWDAFTEATIAQPAPRYTSLADFEGEYYGYLGSPEGSMNYGWYQSVFAELASAIYARRGLGFLAELKERLPWERYEGWTTEEVLRELEAVEPGFQVWARNLEK